MTKEAGQSPRKDARTRNFATLIYPSKDEYEAYYQSHKTWVDHDTGETYTYDHYSGADGYGSPPDDWKERLSQMHIAALISPMHIGDHNPDGSLKKPHYHVMLMYEGKKSYETQIKPIFEQIGGVGREEVGSMRGYARYMLHLDSPEKQRYEATDVTALSGADYETIIQLPGDTMAAFREVKHFIRQHDIHSYAELVDCLEILRPDLEEAVVMKLTYSVTKYLKSVTWEKDKQYRRRMMPEREDRHEGKD